MHAMNIKSKTTLQKLRDEGKIRFTQPQKKIILYDRESIEQYLEFLATLKPERREMITPVEFRVAGMV